MGPTIGGRSLGTVLVQGFVPLQDLLPVRGLAMDSANGHRSGCVHPRTWSTLKLRDFHWIVSISLSVRRDIKHACRVLKRHGGSAVCQGEAMKSAHA